MIKDNSNLNSSETDKNNYEKENILREEQKDENKKNIKEEINTPIKEDLSSIYLDLSKSNSEKLESERDQYNLKEENNLHKSTPFSIIKRDLNKIEDENLNSFSPISILQNLKLNQFNDKSFEYKRKYNLETRKLGKKYFMFRYLKENQIENEQKDLRKKKYFLLITIEKSIFYFNNKKFKECIDLLLNEKIIKIYSEFAEFLFVVDGFNKDIISEFLCEEKNEKILSDFINLIYMDIKQIPFMDTLKLFLSLLNNPKKEVVYKFISLFYMENKDNEIFIKNYKNFDIFLLFANNLIHINNIFIGKEKQNIKIEQFVKMNKDLDKKMCQNIFKEMQINPIFPIDNYVQKYYRKLSFFVKENDESQKEDKTSDIDSYYENILDDRPKRDYINHNIWFSYRKKISTFDKEDEEILLNPILFTKYVTNSTACHPRVFVFRDNFTNLIWAKSIEGDKIKGNLHVLKIEDILDVYMGVDNCEIIKKFLNSNNKDNYEEYNYITIRTKTEAFVIKGENVELNFIWFKAVKSILLKYQMAKNKDKERNNEKTINKMEKAIKKIWSKWIFIQWTEYGRYLLYKKNNKLEYKIALNQNYKKERMFKSDLIDDRINFNLKKIMIFMEQLKNKLNVDNNILDYNEFLFLYKIGIPPSCRHIIWDSLIDNSCGITNDLYNYYSQQIKEIDFKKEKLRLKEININEKINIVNENDELIISDIIKIEDLYINEFFVLQMDADKILYIIYKLIKIFFLMRRDIPYNKILINYTFIFLLIFNEEYISFKNLYNFICSTSIIKYIIQDHFFIEKNYKIFGGMMKKFNPKIYNHFNRLEISNELYSIFWFENLFTQTLNYKIILRVIDLYLIYGDELLFQIGLNIIKIQEDDLLTYPIIEIFKVLKRLPNKFDEELFFENLDLINIHEIYNNNLIKMNLSEQMDFLCSDK